MIKRTIFIETPCHLHYKNGQMIASFTFVKGYEDRDDKSVPLEDIGLLMLANQRITITNFLLDKLASNNIAVVTCNETHHPSGLLMPLESHTLQSERFRFQLEATEPLKKQLWQQTVKAKINNQAILLKQFGVKYQYLQGLANGVKSGDADNYEAVAAAHYWQHLFPIAWQFFRKREGPPPNNLLNYGYAIIRACMARAIVGAGLLPTLGIFHRNRYNAYCLADDLMEPYRPFVDKIVRSIVQETSHVEKLQPEFRNQLLALPTVDVFMAGEKSPLMVAMQRTAVSLSKCFAGEIRKMAYPSLEP